MYYYKTVDCSLRNAKTLEHSYNNIKDKEILHFAQCVLWCFLWTEKRTDAFYLHVNERRVFFNDTAFVMKLKLFLYPF